MYFQISASLLSIIFVMNKQENVEATRDRIVVVQSTLRECSPRRQKHLPCYVVVQLHVAVRVRRGQMCIHDRVGRIAERL